MIGSARLSQVGPDKTVVTGGFGVHEFVVGFAAGGPGDATVIDSQPFGGQDVVGAQVTGFRVGEVGGVVLGRVEVFAVAFVGRGLAPAVGRGEGILDAGCIEQLVDPGEAGPAVLRVGVLVTEDDELGVPVDPATPTLVIDDPVGVPPAGDVVGGQTDFVGVSAPVPLLGSVETGRGGVGDQQVDAASADIDWQVPVRLAGEPEFVGVVAVVVGGQEVAGHVVPEQVLEGTDVVGGQRMLGEHGHAVLAGEITESPGVVGLVQFPVVVEVKSGVHAGVHRGAEGMRVVDAGEFGTLWLFEVVLTEEIEGFPGLVVVELVDQEDVGVLILYDGGNGLGLGIVRSGEVSYKFAFGGAVEAGVVGRDAEVAAVRAWGTAGDRAMRAAGR